MKYERTVGFLRRARGRLVFVEFHIEYTERKKITTIFTCRFVGFYISVVNVVFS